MDLNPDQTGEITIYIFKKDNESFSKKPYPLLTERSEKFRRGIEFAFISLIDCLDNSQISSQSPMYSQEYISEDNALFHVSISYEFGSNGIITPHPKVFEIRGFSRVEILDSLLWYMKRFYQLEFEKEITDKLFASLREIES